MKKILLSFSVIALVAAVTVNAATLRAHDGEDHSQVTTAQANRGSALEPVVEKRAREVVDALRKTDTKQRTQEARQKACEARQSGMATRMGSLQRAAANYQQKIDTVLAAAKTYMTNKAISGAPFEALTQEASSWQTVAALSVTDLKELSVNVDCTKADVATHIATFKLSAAQAREDLMAYKGAVQNLLKALREERQN